MKSVDRVYLVKRAGELEDLANVVAAANRDDASQKSPGLASR